MSSNFKQEKNSVTVIRSLKYLNGKWETHFDEDDIDLNANSNKYHIDHQLYVENGSPSNIVSSIIPKLYKCDATDVDIYDQILTFNEFIFICLNAKFLEFSGVTIKDTDESIIPVEKLVACLPKAKSMTFYLNPKVSTVSTKTMAELLKIRHFSKIDSLSLHQVPETFDVEAFYTHAKKNWRTQFHLGFCFSISAEYMKRLEAIVDDIIQTKYYSYKLPSLNIPELDQNKNCQFQSLHCDSYDDTYY